jgi:hypothetical protein
MSLPVHADNPTCAFLKKGEARRMLIAPPDVCENRSAPLRLQLSLRPRFAAVVFLRTSFEEVVKRWNRRCLQKI